MVDDYETALTWAVTILRYAAVEEEEKDSAVEWKYAEGVIEKLRHIAHLLEEVRELTSTKKEEKSA